MAKLAISTPSAVIAKVLAETLLTAKMLNRPECEGFKMKFIIVIDCPTERLLAEFVDGIKASDVSNPTLSLRASQPGR